MFWEYVGFVGALLVVFGVLLELRDIWHRYGEEITTWAFSYFGVLRSPEKPRFFKKFGIEVASVILVAAGVAGELGAGFMIESKNTELRAIDIQLRSKNAALRSKGDQLVALINERSTGLGVDLETAKAALVLKQSELAKQQAETARAQKEAADAQLALKGYVGRVVRRALSRQLDKDVFLKELSGKPRALVRIWYKPEDDEAYMFAEEVYRWLGNSPGGAGWEVFEPQSIPTTGIPESRPFVWITEPDINTPSLKNPPPLNLFQVPSPYRSSAPSDARFLGIGANGLTVLSNPFDDIMDNTETASATALARALQQSANVSVLVQKYSALSKGEIVLVIGQRR
jgi:hypothetical protein